MVASLTTKPILDGGAGSINRQVLDLSGAGTGPFIAVQVLMKADGSAAVNPATDDSLGGTSAAAAGDTGASSTNGFLRWIRDKLHAGLVLAAGSAVIGKVGMQVGGSDVSTSNPIPVVSTEPTVIDVTLSLDTSAYADGDVLADTQEVTGFFASAAGTRLVQSLMVLDEDDQGVGFDLLFLDAGNSLGTENSAPSISDANARSILARVSVAASDYIDLGGCRVAYIPAIGAVIKAASAQTSVWVAAITRSGTPTYTASGIKLKIGAV